MYYPKQRESEPFTTPEIELDLEGNVTVYFKATIKAIYGMMSSDYDTPNDPDTYEVDIFEAEYWVNGEEFAPSMKQIANYYKTMVAYVIDIHHNDCY